jgi:hypothetical protein
VLTVHSSNASGAVVMEALPSVFAVAVPCADVLSAVSVGLRVAETIPCAQGCVGGGGEGFMCISDMTFSCRPWMSSSSCI